MYDQTDQLNQDINRRNLEAEAKFASEIALQQKENENLLNSEEQCDEDEDVLTPESETINFTKEEVEPETKEEMEAEVKQEIETEAKQKVEPETKQEAETETKQEVKTEAKQEVEAETKQELCTKDEESKEVQQNPSQTAFDNQPSENNQNMEIDTGNQEEQNQPDTDQIMETENIYRPDDKELQDLPKIETPNFSYDFSGSLQRESENSSIVTESLLQQENFCQQYVKIPMLPIKIDMNKWFNPHKVIHLKRFASKKLIITLESMSKNQNT